MPATKQNVIDALDDVTEPSTDVFLLVGEGKQVFWSAPGSGSDVQKAKFHAESDFLRAFDQREVEEGEIVEVTIKWSPCGTCAMRLVDLSQILQQRQALLEVYYLDVFHGKGGGVLGSLDPFDVLAAAGVKLAAYETTHDGAWWNDGKRMWAHKLG
ncbi:MAG TPA: hypothetical protein VF092_15400 [Longimicrobium sp.]